ncbi:MAG: hypothetical protein IPO09_11825 [Anaeromyxobacter sp.]|nr:hypothetical protein [Anaeromyxobacter sp.]MBL0276278.1 hypothetical protein [Anaeromyxobacter sp.]
MPRRLLLLLAVVLAAATGWWLATRPPPLDDAQQIRTLFLEAARAAGDRRASDAVAGLSESFRGQGLDRRDAKRAVAALALRGAWVAVTVADVRVEVAGDQASAEVDVLLSRGGAGSSAAALLPAAGGAWRFDCRLAREAEGWRVVEASWAERPLAELLGAPAP